MDSFLNDLVHVTFSENTHRAPEIEPPITILKSSDLLDWGAVRAMITSERPHERISHVAPSLWFMVPKSSLDFRRSLSGGQFHQISKPWLVTIAAPNETVHDILGSPVVVLHVFVATSLLNDVATATFSDINPEDLFSNVFEIDDPLIGTVLSIIEEALDDHAVESKLKVAYLARALVARFLQITHVRAGPARGAERPRQINAKQLRVLQRLLQKEPARRLSVAEMAHAVGLNKVQFLKSFKAFTGVSPHQWVIMVRIQKAKVLLVKSNLTLSDIAESCGFASQTHMSTIFRRLVTSTPAAYRRKMRDDLNMK